MTALTFEDVIWRLAGLRRGHSVHLRTFINPLHPPDPIGSTTTLAWYDGKSGAPSREIVLHEASHMCLTGYRFAEETAALILEFLCLMLIFHPKDFGSLGIPKLSSPSNRLYLQEATNIILSHETTNPHWVKAWEALQHCLPEISNQAYRYNRLPALRRQLHRRWKLK